MEIFDHADLLLRSAPDVSPIAAQLQVKVRDVATQTTDPVSRTAIDKLIREEIIPAFQRYSVAGAGMIRNNWVGTTTIGNYGEDFVIRRVYLAPRSGPNVPEPNWLPAPEGKAILADLPHLCT